MNLTPTEQLVLRRIISDLADADERGKIAEELTSGLFTEPAVIQETAPKDNRPPVPNFPEVRDAMQAINVALAHNLSYEEITEIIKNHPRWPIRDNFSAATLKQMIRSTSKGYIWSKRDNGWSPFFHPYKLYLFALILKEKFPEITVEGYVS